MRAIIVGLATALVLATAVIAAQVAEAQVPDCVTRSEYQNARSAWQAEGLTRPGVRYYFDFDGALVGVHDGAMKRRYRGCNGVPTLVKYRHFPAAPGPSSVWWVVRMWRAT